MLQRQLTLDTSTQVFGRAVFAGVALLAYVAVVDRGRVLEAFRSIGLAGIAVALCVAVASASFIGALNHSSVARVLFILAVSPMLAALLARVTLGEPISRRTVMAMGLALVGVAVMLGTPGEGSLAGDGLAFLCALAFAVMVVISTGRSALPRPATLAPRMTTVMVRCGSASADAEHRTDLGRFPGSDTVRRRRPQRRCTPFPSPDRAPATAAPAPLRWANSGARWLH